MLLGHAGARLSVTGKAPGTSTIEPCGVGIGGGQGLMIAV